MLVSNHHFFFNSLDQCTFHAHPICLGHRERQEWGFIVDNRVASYSCMIHL